DITVLNIDNSLRDVPGFTLYRRTSSVVANPTTQAYRGAVSALRMPAARFFSGMASAKTILSAVGFTSRSPPRDSAFRPAMRTGSRHSLLLRRRLVSRGYSDSAIPVAVYGVPHFNAGHR